MTHRTTKLRTLKVGEKFVLTIECTVLKAASLAGAAIASCSSKDGGYSEHYLPGDVEVLADVES